MQALKGLRAVGRTCLRRRLVSPVPSLPLGFSPRGRWGKSVILSFCQPSHFFTPLRFVIGVKRLLFWRTSLVRLGSWWAPGGLPETLSSSSYDCPPIPPPRAGSVVPPTLTCWHVCKEHNNNHPVMWRKQLKTPIFHVAPR